MLSLPNQFAKVVGFVNPAARASWFGKLSMTFFFSFLPA